MDLHMPGLDGLKVLEQIRARELGIPTIMITANTQPEMRDRCMKIGAVAYLHKPLDRELVCSVIERATGRTNE